MSWISGVSMEVIAYLTLRDSSNKREAEQWLRGQSEHPPSWFEVWIEDLASFCNSYLGNQWSWVCRGAAFIARGIGHEELAGELERVALQLSYGVSQSEVQELLRQGCPVDRAKLDWIVREYKRISDEGVAKPERLMEWLGEQDQYLLETPIGIFQALRISERDISALEQFVRRRLGKPRGK
jgi:hypothetical protein